MLNKNTDSFTNYNLSSPRNIEQILKRLNFKYFRFISSAKIINALKNKKNIINFYSKDIKNPKVYNIIFTSKKLLKIDKKIFNFFQKNKINYYQDNDLLNDLKKYEKVFDN